MRCVTASKLGGGNRPRAVDPTLPAVGDEDGFVEQVESGEELRWGYPGSAGAT